MCNGYKGTQTRVIPGNAVSIYVIVWLVSEMERKYSGTLARYRHSCPGEFEPANPASERPQTHAIDRATARIGTTVDLLKNYLC